MSSPLPVYRAHSQGKCINCFHANDRLPLLLCGLCAKIQAAHKKLTRIAARIEALEAEERALMVERQRLLKERVSRRDARAPELASRPKATGKGNGPKRNRTRFNALIASRQHPWQVSDRARWAERQGR